MVFGCAYLGFWHKLPSTSMKVSIFLAIMLDHLWMLSVKQKYILWAELCPFRGVTFSFSPVDCPTIHPYLQNHLWSSEVSPSPLFLLFFFLFFPAGQIKLILLESGSQDSNNCGLLLFYPPSYPLLHLYFTKLQLLGPQCPQPYCLLEAI